VRKYVTNGNCLCSQVATSRSDVVRSVICCSATSSWCRCSF